VLVARYAAAMLQARASALCLALLVACNSPQAQHPKRMGDTIRYRLLLRNNPVSPGDASRCFAECQPAATPKQYVECLELCPGFEKTPGEYCSNTDIPPEAACLTVRKIPAKTEPPPGLVVLAIIGEVALVVGAASLCNISNTQCGWQAVPPPR
jgi:hypothetical protein